MANTLSYQWLLRPATYHENGAVKQHNRHHIDWLIDGQSLSALLQISDSQLIGNLGWGTNPGYEISYLQELLLEQIPELPNGRTMLYVCPECGDIGCGAITTQVSKSDNYYIWSSLVYENGYSEPDFEEYKSIGFFMFEEAAYLQCMQALQKEIDNASK